MDSECVWLDTELLGIFATEPYLDDADQPCCVYEKEIDSLLVQIRVLNTDKILALSLRGPSKVEPYFTDYYLVKGDIQYIADESKLILNRCWLLASDTDYSQTPLKDLGEDNHFRVELHLGDCFSRYLFLGG